MSLVYLASTGLLACRARRPALGAGALLLLALPASTAQAQCTAVDLNMTAPLTQTVATAVAGVSASVGSLVSSIQSTNTAFLAQSNAFISSPAKPQPDQQGGGAWARGIAGQLTTDTVATAGNFNFGGPISGNIICNTRTQGDFAGVQVGADVARLNVNGWNLHAGSTIGYFGSKTRDATPSGLNPPPSFRDNLQIPFAGVYFAASSGGLLIDGQVRGTFYQNEVSDINHGMSGQRFDARGIGLIGNVAYNHKFDNHWFVEPSAGIIWSRTRVDPLNVPGTVILGYGSVPPWVLAVQDIESTLGRLSLRVGTSVAFGDVVVQPFASASVLHEFQRGVIASLTTDFAALGVIAPTLSSTVAISNPGTYGQFGLGASAQIVNTGWVGYLRGDYRTGADIEGWSLNGGLRYHFVPDPRGRNPNGRDAVFAMAPVHKAPAVAAVYNWTGFYVGAHLGVASGFTDWDLVGAGTTTDPRFAGVLVGGEIGYNYQVGQWVLGVEGDVSWSNARGTRPCQNGFFFNCEIEVNWLSTTTARVGYAYWDRLLLYAKGGAVIAQDRAQTVCNINCPSASDSKTRAGWTVGWGSEFGLTRNVSVKGEVMYFNLGTDRYTMGGTVADIQRDGFTSSAGLHFRFGE